MIRQQAFINKNGMLKGALHCHTTRSDGAATPKQALEIYKEHGYDFVAITDHKKYNFINFAPETGLLVIPATEYDAVIEKDAYGRRVHHTVCLGPLKEDGNGFNQDDFGPERPDSAVTNEMYQVYLDEIHAKGNLTIHAHPEWSNTPPAMFEKLQGNVAMEVCNTGGALEYDMDCDNGVYWDELLGKGYKLWGVAADDAHGLRQFGKGWVMVNAEKNVNSVLEAIREGKFYSTTGPEIYDFYVDDDNTAHIECSPAAKIRLHGIKHPTRIQRADGELLTKAQFKLETKTGLYEYCRISVIDANGNIAWTNPIFLHGKFYNKEL
ncbi:MAG: hypothetical protein E7287_11370 [Lachnospiraceae bacterium]|nr:hypothetical protein [Lachnospiraceae bacterium]